jgi:hypothetical protein
VVTTFQRFDSQTHSMRSACVSRRRWGRDRFTAQLMAQRQDFELQGSPIADDARNVTSYEMTTDRIDEDANC